MGLSVRSVLSFAREHSYNVWQDHTQEEMPLESREPELPGTPQSSSSHDMTVAVRPDCSPPAWSDQCHGACAEAAEREGGLARDGRAEPCSLVTRCV